MPATSRLDLSPLHAFVALMQWRAHAGLLTDGDRRELRELLDLVRDVRRAFLSTLHNGRTP